MSVPEPPWAASTFPRSPCVPPTSRWFAVTPGIVVPTVANDRAVGSASSASFASCFRSELLCTSTTGDCPDTVIVSETAPTLRDALTGATNPAEISTPSRRTEVKPVSVKVTVYTPGRSCCTENWPALSLTAVRVFSISAGLAASTVTPGRTAPLLSFTTPAIVPNWAKHNAGKTRYGQCARHEVPDDLTHTLSFVS